MRTSITSDINKAYAAIMNYDRVDRFIVRILWGHFAMVVLLALTNAVLQLSLKMPSPFAWRVISGPEAVGAVLVALAAAGLPTLMRGRSVSHYRWRIGITVALITYSYVFVFLSGGSIEMHFHFFMSMALLVVYADWRLGWVVLLMAGAHHGILNYVAPGWVYFYGRNDLAVLAHGLPVAATAIFTTLLSNNHRRSLVDTERRRQAAEALASVGRLLSETLDVELIGQRITQSVRDVLGLAAAELHRLEADSGALVIVAVCESPRPGTEPPDAGPRASAAQSRPAAPQRSTLDVSLQLKGRLIGILRLVDGPGRVFSDSERRTADLFADQAALALENARLYAEATRRQRDAEGLAAAARTLTGSLDEAEVAKGIVSRARLLLGARLAGLHLTTPDGASIEVAGTTIDGHPAADPIPTDIGITSAVVARGEAVLCSDVGTDFRLTLSEALRGRITEAGIHRVLGVPLRVNGRAVGAITVADGERSAFSRADVTLLESFADQAALALENARLYRAQQGQAASEREARATAEASSRRFRDLVNDLDAIVWEADTSPFRISFISEHAEPILGYPTEEWVRDPALLERHLHPDDRARVMAAFNAATVRGQEQVMEYRALTAEGRVRWLRTTLRVGMGPDGHPRVRGLTVKRRRLEEQVRQGQKLEAIGTLAGGIAHDFNNILAAVLGFSELAIREAGDRDKVSGHLSQVLTASRRARDLVQQILTFSRPQNQDQVHQPTDLKAILEEVLKLMRAALPSTIEIQTNLRTTNTTIRGVGSELHQVLMNLCTNAGHAMRDHGGRLEVGLDLIHVDVDLAAHETDLAEGHYVKLSVTDTGTGMDRTTLDRIFEPFFTTKAAGEGTGLGLSVVHGIVRSHRGAVKVYSERGQGTNFDLYFPLLEGAAALEIIEAEPPRGRGEHVLLVDDEEPLVLMGHAILERLGYRVTSLTSSLAALETFRRTPDRFDVVVTDQTMPKLTGTELASELRRLRPDLPIILISGHSVQADRERARSLGIAELLAKPSTSHALGTAIHRALAQGTPVSSMAP